MIADPRAESRSTHWTWIAAIWCAGASFNASQALLTMHAVGAGKTWLRPFLIVFFSWLPWLLAAPWIIGLARRWPIARGHLPKALGLHLGALVSISVMTEGWSALLRVMFNPWHRSSPPTFLNAWSDLIVEQFMMFLIVYVLILMVTYVADTRERMAWQAAQTARLSVETARLNEELSRAQLAALRGQMDPHFIFNTLNSIASLVVDEHPDAAVGMIVGLSEFLRRASEDSHRAEVALQEEVEYLQRYLDIQKLRFGERLRVSVDIPDELRTAQVPSLLLQPLVENAIKHGVGKSVSGGVIRVAARRSEAGLRLTVYNDGPWVQEDLVVSPQGVGLGNLRTRLKILHGDRSELVLQPAQARGVEVIVTLPFQVG